MHNATELQVKNQPSQQFSHSLISSHEQINRDELLYIFRTLSKGQPQLGCEQLYGFLQEEGYVDCLYNAVEMIAMVDRGRKGYLQQEEFVEFFSQGGYNEEERLPSLPKEMGQDRLWAKRIDENWEQYKHYLDEEYCEWVRGKLQERQNDHHSTSKHY